MPSSDSRPPWRLGLRLVLIALPVIAFCTFAVTTLSALGMLSFLAAMGHGSLDWEPREIWLIVAVVATPGSVVAAFVLERTYFGPRASRSAQINTLTWQNRVASALVIVLLTIAAPPAASWWIDWRARTGALDRDNEDRHGSIVALELRPTPAGRETLISIALDPTDDDGSRTAAIAALRVYGDTRDVFLTLTADRAPEVRAAAARALLPAADDPKAWGAIAQLARDPSLIVRERVAAALAEGSVPAAVEERRRALLREIASSDTPVAALSATSALGAEGYDAAIALLMNRSLFDERRQAAIGILGKLRDPRAVDLLRDIVNDNTAEGFLALDHADGYREAAANALVSILGEDGDELASAYFNESQTRFELRFVTEAQTKYAAATGFFDARLACLELPATCAPGRDADESFLGPALASDAPRHGYRRQLIAGPAASASEIAARRASPTSTTAFAYVVVPQSPGRSGLRAYCADDTGMVCVGLEGRAPDVRGGRCVCQAP